MDSIQDTSLMKDRYLHSDTMRTFGGTAIESTIAVSNDSDIGTVLIAEIAYEDDNSER